LIDLHNVRNFKPLPSSDNEDEDSRNYHHSKER